MKTFTFKPIYFENLRIINGFYYFSNTIYFLFFKISWNSKAIKCILCYLKSDKVEITYKNKLFKKAVLRIK